MQTIVLVILATVVIHTIGFIGGTKYREILDILRRLQHQEESTPAEIITSSPNKSAKPYISPFGSGVVTTKSPQQLEKEAKEEVDRIGGI